MRLLPKGLKPANRRKRYERALHELDDIRDVIQAEGQYSGCARYQEIMAKLLLSIDDSLLTLRTLFSALLGFAAGIVLSGLFARL